MSLCDEFKEAVKIQIRIRSETKIETVIRTFWRSLGLEFAYDLYKGKGIDWGILFDLLIVFDIVSAFKLLTKFGFTGAVAKFLAKLGPWAIALYVVIIIAEITLAIKKFSIINKRFIEKISDLYSHSDCDKKTKDQILKELNVDF
jgi:hypothetical protein